MEGLLAICANEGIHVSYQPLDPTWGLLGMFTRDKHNRPIIVLDPSLQSNPPLERSVLGEEVGHFKTEPVASACTVYFCYTQAILLSRDDRKALRWACNEYFMPNPMLAEAIRKGYRSVDELAEYFYVARWIVTGKLQFLRQDLWLRQRMRVRWRDLFSPLLIETMWGESL